MSAIHGQMDRCPLEVLEELLPFHSCGDLEVSSEAIDHRADAPFQFFILCRDVDALCTESTCREGDVGRHPLVPLRPMSQPEDVDVGHGRAYPFSLSIRCPR